MSTIKLHPDFKLQGNSFQDKISFLDFIKQVNPEDFSFLSNLLDNTTVLKVSTSGSTGKPKQIFLSKKAMLNSAKATSLFFDLPAKTKALHCLSSNYIAGKMMWVRALSLGWDLDVVTPNSNPLNGNNNHYDFCAMVPLQAQNSLLELKRIHKLIIGGGPISYSLEKEIAKLPTLSYHTYGMTETITHIAVRLISKEGNNHYISLPNVTFSLDKRSCLQINAPRISKEFVVTNDLVTLHSTTQFEWLGRIDNVINSGGIKLFPEQIEQKLAPFINKPFIITSIPDATLGEKLILLIESEKDKKIENKIKKATLSKYEKPKDIVFLNAFVYTENGKIVRKDTLALLNKL